MLPLMEEQLKYYKNLNEAREQDREMNRFVLASIESLSSRVAKIEERLNISNNDDDSESVKDAS